MHSFSGHQNILFNIIKKLVVKAKKICKMEPLSILLKMACKKCKVPDDHVIMHMHTPIFQRERMCFFVWQIIWNIRGVTFCWRLTITLSIVCWTVPQNCEQSKYSFKYFSLLLFQILPRARAWENQNGIPFLVLALLPFHTEPEQPDDPIGLDLTPVIIFLKV